MKNNVRKKNESKRIDSKKSVSKKSVSKKNASKKNGSKKSAGKKNGAEGVLIGAPDYPLAAAPRSWAVFSAALPNRLSSRPLFFDSFFFESLFFQPIFSPNVRLHVPAAA